MQKKFISRSIAGSIVVEDGSGLFTEDVCLRIKSNRSSLNDNLNLESMEKPKAKPKEECTKIFRNQHCSQCNDF